MNDSTQEPAEVSSKSKVAVIILAILAAAGVIGSAVLGYYYSEATKKNEELTASLAAKEQEVATLNGNVSSLEGELSDTRAEVERIKADWAQNVQKLKVDHEKQIENAREKMNEIIYDSKEVIGYMETLRDKLKAGQSLNQKETQDLKAVAGGLAMLHEQYQKPLEEFRELENYFTEELQRQGVLPPDKGFRILKRIFSKKFRAEEEAYFRDQGKRNAFETAKGKVAAAYSRAQSEMESLGVKTDQYLDDLNKIVESNDASVKEMEDFFTKSEEMLKIHDRAMDLEPDTETQPNVKP